MDFVKGRLLRPAGKGIDMNKKVILKGKLGIYLRWPFLLGIIPAAAMAAAFWFDYRAGLAAAVALVVYITAATVIWLQLKPAVMEELVSFAAGFSDVQLDVFGNLDFPYAILDEEGHILWANNAMHNLFGPYIEMNPIAGFIPEISHQLLTDTAPKVIHIRHKDLYYKAEMYTLDSRDFMRDNPILTLEEERPLRSLCLFEETEVVETRKAIQNQRLVCGVILVDNYEEALESTEEVRRSLLSALVERKITKYLQNYDAIINKMEKDKYMFVIRQQYMPALQSSKFSLLDEVREISIGNEMNVTLCIGIGANAENYAQAQEWARHALDLALGRGGDQAVLKDHEKISYYGGKTKQVEKATRVRARVKAHALRQVLEGKDQVVIMGHKMGDADCVGAAIGIYRAARLLNKRAYIVVNDITSSIRPIISNFLDNPDYDADMFVNSETARDLVDMNTAVIVVDVSTSDRVEAPELLNLTRTVVVIDHHRQSGKSIENPVLTYIEPYASSACEMVVEILQYVVDNVKLRPEEADALYSGIVIDTNNFRNETGVRTFEAAAFLRKKGADINRVKLKLRDDMVTSKARAEAVNKAVIEKGYAFAVCPSEGLENPTVVGAQAANELLGISGIEASFVFTKVGDVIFVSARSLDNMNVQLVMERVGGGGHSTIAGAQLRDMTMDEAVSLVRSTVLKMKEEGEV